MFLQFRQQRGGTPDSDFIQVFGIHLFSYLYHYMELSLHIKYLVAFLTECQEVRTAHIT